MPDGSVLGAEAGEQLRQEGEELCGEFRVQEWSQNFKNLKTVYNSLSRRNELLTKTC